MYMVEKTDTRAGRETVVVKHRGRLVCSASVAFIKWMHDRVPLKQLRSEQVALVDWYEKHEQVTDGR